MEDFIRISAGRDADWTREILARCPTLVAGCRPSALMRNGHMQTGAVIYRDRGAPPAAWEREDRIVAADGGTVSIQWAGLDADPSLPVIVLMHTICGSADSLRRFVAALRKRLGWTVACCNRRGHADLPLTAPSVNTMGNTADLDLQLDRIQQVRPGARLLGVGVSAGSGLLVRYLGESGSDSRLIAGVGVCPAYELPTGLSHAHPRYNRYMTSKMIDFFLDRHRDVLGHLDGFDRACSATDMVSFHEALYPMAGFDDYETYLAASDPMRVALDAKVPALVLNAHDDPVCSKRNVDRHRDAMLTLDRITLAETRYGGHVGFYEKPGARESWADDAIAEYLVAADALLPG